MKKWGEHTRKLFAHLNNAIYNLIPKGEQSPFCQGAYSFDNDITSETTNFLFWHFLLDLDFQKSLESPPLLMVLAEHISSFVEIPLTICSQKSQLLLIRYPGDSFFQLFGKKMTFPTIDLGESYDPALALIVKSLINAISNFYFPEDSDFVIRVLSYILSLSTIEHPPILIAYFENVSKLYNFYTSFLPFISLHSMSLIAKFDPCTLR